MIRLVLILAGLYEIAHSAVLALFTAIFTEDIDPSAVMRDKQEKDD